MDRERVYTANNRIYLSATNLNEFDTLIETANRQAKELQETINQLRCFDIQLEIKEDN